MYYSSTEDASSAEFAVNARVMTSYQFPTQGPISDRMCEAISFLLPSVDIGVTRLYC